jgi:hypothetical protein
MTGITYREFLQRFTDDQEIGREISCLTVRVYYDNGSDVGRIIYDRLSSRSTHELLSARDAACARQYANNHPKSRNQNSWADQPGFRRLVQLNNVEADGLYDDHAA